jgi:hypothetical protein
MHQFPFFLFSALFGAWYTSFRAHHEVDMAEVGLGTLEPQAARGPRRTPREAAGVGRLPIRQRHRLSHVVAERGRARHVHRIAREDGTDTAAGRVGEVRLCQIMVCQHGYLGQTAS